METHACVAKRLAPYAITIDLDCTYFAYGAEHLVEDSFGDAWAQARLALGALDQATIAESLARETLAQAERTRALGQTRHGEGEIDGGALTRLDAAVSAARAALADASAARARAYLDLILAAGGRA